MTGDADTLELLAARVYSFRRAADLRRRRRERGPVPTWEQLEHNDRARRRRCLERCLLAYKANRLEATESPVLP